MNIQQDTISGNGLLRSLTETRRKAAQQFNLLPPRDRLALALLGGFVALLILVYGMILPAVDFHTHARQNFLDQQALLNWLKDQQPALQAARSSAGTASSTSPTGNPLTLVNSSAKDFAMKIIRLQPENNGSLRVWMEDVRFDNTLRWLHHLQAQGLVVKEIYVEQQKKETVSVRVVF